MCRVCYPLSLLLRGEKNSLDRSLQVRPFAPLARDTISWLLIIFVSICRLLHATVSKGLLFRSTISHMNFVEDIVRRIPCLSSSFRRGPSVISKLARRSHRGLVNFHKPDSTSELANDDTNGHVDANLETANTVRTLTEFRWNRLATSCTAAVSD